MEHSENHLIWISCEVTGTNPETDYILEISCIITSQDLFEVARHDAIVINVPDKILEAMPSWSIKAHAESGLTQASKDSTISIAEAEQLIIQFLRNYTKAGSCPMAGSSTFLDRLFLMKQMPELYKHFHRKFVDVTSLQELVRRWFPKVYGGSPSKKFRHRTITDIEESIAELQYYRQVLFRK